MFSLLLEDRMYDVAGRKGEEGSWKIERPADVFIAAAGTGGVGGSGAAAATAAAGGGVDVGGIAGWKYFPTNLSISLALLIGGNSELTSFDPRPLPRPEAKVSSEKERDNKGSATYTSASHFISVITPFLLL